MTFQSRPIRTFGDMLRAYEGLDERQREVFAKDMGVLMQAYAEASPTERVMITLARWTKGLVWKDDTKGEVVLNVINGRDEVILSKTFRKED